MATAVFPYVPGTGITYNFEGRAAEQLVVDITLPADDSIDLTKIVAQCSKRAGSTWLLTHAPTVTTSAGRVTLTWSAAQMTAIKALKPTLPESRLYVQILVNAVEIIGGWLTVKAAATRPKEVAITIGRATDVETVLARDVAVTDAGGKWTGRDVEAVLAEVPSRYASINFVAGAKSTDNPGSGDHSSLVSDAIASARALAITNGSMSAAEVVLGPYTYNINNVAHAGQVHVTGRGTTLQANGAGPMFNVTGEHAKFTQLMFNGAGAAVDAQGIKFASGSKWGRVEGGVKFDSFALEAIELATGSSSHEVLGILATNCLLDAATLGAVTGVIKVAGSDHQISGGEVTASRSSLSASGFAYALAITGANCAVFGGQYEISDHGVYVNASHARLIGTRADLNRGHGFVIAGGSGSLEGCLSLSNGRETTNTYDGYNFANNTNFQVDGCRAAGSGNTHRYGFYDVSNGATNHNTFAATNRSSNHGTTAIFIDNAYGGHVQTASGPFNPVSAAATSIDSQQYGWPQKNWQLSSVSAVNFTGFTNSVVGDMKVIVGDGQSTFVHGSYLKTSTGANKLAANGVFYTFICGPYGVWQEIT